MSAGLLVVIRIVIIVLVIVVVVIVPIAAGPFFAFAVAALVAISARFAALFPITITMETPLVVWAAFAIAAEKTVKAVTIPLAPLQPVVIATIRPITFSVNGATDCSRPISTQPRNLFTQLLYLGAKLHDQAKQLGLTGIGATRSLTLRPSVTESSIAITFRTFAIPSTVCSSRLSFSVFSIPSTVEFSMFAYSTCPFLGIAFATLAISFSSLTALAPFTLVFLLSDGRPRGIGLSDECPHAQRRDQGQQPGGPQARSL